MSRRVLCIDTELSCWEDTKFQKAQISEIFEFGMAIVDLEQMKITRSGHYYVTNERHRVTPFCTGLTGITQRILHRQGFPLQQVAEMLITKWGSKNQNMPIMAWGDERSFMAEDFQAKRIAYPFHNDLINLAKYYRFGEMGNTRNISLVDACLAMGADVEHPLHSAKSDAITLANLLLKMVENGLIWPKLSRG